MTTSPIFRLGTRLSHLRRSLIVFRHRPIRCQVPTKSRKVWLLQTIYFVRKSCQDKPIFSNFLFSPLCFHWGRSGILWLITDSSVVAWSSTNASNINNFRVICYGDGFVFCAYKLWLSVKVGKNFWLVLIRLLKQFELIMEWDLTRKWKLMSSDSSLV